MNAIDLNNIRKITLYYVDGTPSSYLMHKDMVDRFVEASKRLHFKPGRNPHNNETASRIWQITEAKFEARGPFWWTTPDLQENGDPAGAVIIDGGIEKSIWTDFAQVAAWEAEEVEAEAKALRERADSLRAEESA